MLLNMAKQLYNYLKYSNTYVCYLYNNGMLHIYGNALFHGVPFSFQYGENTNTQFSYIVKKSSFHPSDLAPQFFCWFVKHQFFFSFCACITCVMFLLAKNNSLSLCPGRLYFVTVFLYLSRHMFPFLDNSINLCYKVEEPDIFYFYKLMSFGRIINRCLLIE